MRGRRRRGRYGRHPAPVYIDHTTTSKAFNPEPKSYGEPVQLEPAEIEVLRLVDIEDMNQQQAGEKMGVSRGTVWRLLHSGRKKITMALVEGRRIEIIEHSEE
ncbi:MAG: DUF134 domain-containing protein [Candidatus Bathyarchaeota archaeon]|nr:DUF134 domain-containing protein [Candidatus Bathyarchaeota archaeon]